MKALVKSSTTAVLVVAAVLGATLPGAARAATVTATSGGVERSVGVGSILATGAKDGNGACDFPDDLAITASEPAGAGPAGVDVRAQVNGSCELVLKSAADTGGSDPAPDMTKDNAALGTSASPDAATSAMQLTRRLARAAAEVPHRGWTKTVVQEQFGVTATEVYVRMLYIRNGGSVYSGHGPYGYDYHSGWPCWSMNNLVYNWWPYGSASVWINRKTHFHNCTGNIDYTLRAKFIADPGPRHICRMPQGSLPTFWDFRCRGGFS
jgi:hypothetical protein